jgi:hypothetical protein
VPSERETERRLAPVPVEVPQVDPERKPSPVPQTEPRPNRWRVKPEAPPLVRPGDPLPTRKTTTEPPQPSTPPQRKRQIVPPTVPKETVLVRRVVNEERRRVLTTEVQSETETQIIRRRRTRTAVTEGVLGLKKARPAISEDLNTAGSQQEYWHATRTAANLRRQGLPSLRPQCSYVLGAHLGRALQRGCSGELPERDLW